MTMYAASRADCLYFHVCISPDTYPHILNKTWIVAICSQFSSEPWSSVYTLSEYWLSETCCMLWQEQHYPVHCDRHPPTGPITRHKRSPYHLWNCTLLTTPSAFQPTVLFKDISPACFTIYISKFPPIVRVLHHSVVIAANTFLLRSAFGWPLTLCILRLCFPQLHG